MSDTINDIEINDECISVGFITLSRKIQYHPFFLEKPFSKFHAFIWLLLNARYSTKPVTRLIGGHMVTWSRGQLPGSLRYLAEAFGWSTKKVNNWLSFLEDQQTVKRISSETRSATILQLINYETYQKRKQEETQGGKHQNNEANQPQQRDSAYTNTATGNTERNTERNIEETPGKHRGNKTEKKDVNKEENNVSVLGKNYNSHTHNFFLSKEEEEKYSDQEKEQIKIIYGYICRYAPVLLKFEKPLTPKECLAFSKKYTEKIAIHIFKAIENKVGIEKRNKSAAETLNIFLRNESCPEIKAAIEKCNRPSKPQGSFEENIIEQKGRALIDSVINDRPANATKDIQTGEKFKTPVYTDSG